MRTVVTLPQHGSKDELVLRSDDTLWRWDDTPTAPQWRQLTSGAAGIHNLLSASHGDSLAGTPARGDVIVGNSTPRWSRLVLGGAGQFLRSNGSDPAWAALVAADIPVLDYLYKPGIAGGQVAYGGTAAANLLELRANSTSSTQGVLKLRSATTPTTDGQLEFTGSRMKFMTASAQILNSAGMLMINLGPTAVTRIPKLSINTPSSPTGRFLAFENGDLIGGNIPLMDFMFASRQQGNFVGSQVLTAFWAHGTHNLSDSIGSSFDLSQLTVFLSTLLIDDDGGTGVLGDFTEFLVDHENALSPGSHGTAVITNAVGFDLKFLPVGGTLNIGYRQRQTTHHNRLAGPMTLGIDASPGVIGGDISNTLANPTVVTTTVPHGLTTGGSVVITGSNSTPTIDGTRVVTVLSPTTFSVAVNVTVAGTTGMVQADNALFDMVSTTRAPISPRMTTTQRDLMTPVDGMWLYNTTTGMFNLREGGAWNTLAGAAGTPHNFLSGNHGDTLAGTVVTGDVVVGNATPAWSRLARSVPAAGVRNVFGLDNGDTIPSWKTAIDSSMPADVAAIGGSGVQLTFSRSDHGHGMGNEIVHSEHLAPVVEIETCTADTGVTGSAVDITGCAVSTPDIGIASVALVWGVFDISVGVLGESFVGELLVDAGGAHGQAAIMVAAVGGDRKTVSQFWLVAVSAGTHVFKLRGRRTGGTGSATFFANHTRIMVMLVGDDFGVIS